MIRAPTLFDRQRVDRRADRAGDRNGRRHEHELVDFVDGAIIRDSLEIEDLSHGHAHDRDGDPVPGLVDALLALVGPHFAAPGVAGKRRQFGAIDPFQRFEREAGRVAARIAVPASSLDAAFHLAGAHDHVIAALERDALLFCRLVEVDAGHAVAVIERFHALEARHVEQHAAADHLVLGLLDAALLRAGAGHLAAVVTVPPVSYTHLRAHETDSY